jgi:hypothetical protein
VQEPDAQQRSGDLVGRPIFGELRVQAAGEAGVEQDVGIPFEHLDRIEVV